MSTSTTMLTNVITALLNSGLSVQDICGAVPKATKARASARTKKSADTARQRTITKLSRTNAQLSDKLDDITQELRDSRSAVARLTRHRAEEADVRKRLVEQVNDLLEYAQATRTLLRQNNIPVPEINGAGITTTADTVELLEAPKTRN